MPLRSRRSSQARSRSGCKRRRRAVRDARHRDCRPPTSASPLRGAAARPSCPRPHSRRPTSRGPSRRTPADGQVVFLPPGTFGSLRHGRRRCARRAGSRARVTYAETGTLPYLARKRGQRPRVAITIRAKRLPDRGLPARHGHAQRSGRSRTAFPVGRAACEDALSGGADERRADHPPAADPA